MPEQISSDHLIPAHTPDAKANITGITPDFVRDLHDPHFDDDHGVDWLKVAKPAPAHVVERHIARATGNRVNLNPRLRV